MEEGRAIEELQRYAEDYASEAFAVRHARASVDESQDGEPVTRVLLLLSDPEEDTWDVDQMRALRLALGEQATDLGLPAVSLTLVAESEQEEAGVFL